MAPAIDKVLSNSDFFSKRFTLCYTKTAFIAKFFFVVTTLAINASCNGIFVPLGTTTVECKSGYGLEASTEIKMLTVLEKAKKNLPIEISSTFLGAHSVPK